MIDGAYVQRMARYNRWQNENVYGVAGTLSDDERRRGWADALDPPWLTGDHAYYSGAIKRELARPRWVPVTHMFNHQTHHRGQVHCMLSQAAGRPSDTDLSFTPD